MTEMFTPPSKSFYELDAAVGKNSLNDLAAAHFGRRYDALAATEPLGNDRTETVGLTNEADCDSWIESASWNSDGKDPFETWANTPDTSHNIGTHVFEDDNPAWPDPRAVMAKMVLDGALPYGTYLLSIWW